MLQAVKEVRKLSNSDLVAEKQVKPDLSKYKDILSSVSFAETWIAKPKCKCKDECSKFHSEQ